MTQNCMCIQSIANIMYVAFGILVQRENYNNIRTHLNLWEEKIHFHILLGMTRIFKDSNLCYSLDALQINETN